MHPQELLILSKITIFSYLSISYSQFEFYLLTTNVLKVITYFDCNTYILMHKYIYNHL